MKKSARTTELIYLLLLCISCIPYLYLSLFSHPIADDFCSSHMNGTQSISESLIDLDFSWNGRYIANYFGLINPLQHS